MSVFSFDALVVGGGPAGSMTALTAVRRGLRVLQIERNPSFGATQRCAEGVLQQQLQLYLEPKPEFIRTEVHGVRFYAPCGLFMELNRPHSGYILDRKRFDAYLAQIANEAGVTQWLSAFLAQVRPHSQRCVEAEIFRNGEIYKVTTPVIAGADGADSRVGRFMGLHTAMPLEAVGCACQEVIEWPGLDPNKILFWVGKQVAPEGYGWVFPRGGSEANAGVVVSGRQNKKKTAEEYYQELKKKYFPSAKILHRMCGAIPGFVKGQEIVSDHVLLVGDAARQVNPLTGSGILEALRAGVIAGEILSDALEKKDFSKKALRHYRDDWEEFLGKTHAKFARIRQAIDKVDDEVFNSATQILQQMDPAKLCVREIFKVILMKKPRLILELRHLF